MEDRTHLELTIRTATLIKSLSQFIGVRDPLIARMILVEASEQWVALSKFVQSVQMKRGSPTTSTGDAGV